MCSIPSRSLIQANILENVCIYTESDVLNKYLTSNHNKRIQETYLVSFSGSEVHV